MFSSFLIYAFLHQPFRFVEGLSMQISTSNWMAGASKHDMNFKHVISVLSVPQTTRFNGGTWFSEGNQNKAHATILK